MAASSGRHLHLLQSQWSTLPINYGSGLVSQILESRASLSRYFRRRGVFAYRTRECYLIGRSIPGRDLFSVPSPVAEIAATENVATTVLQKSMCLEKFEGALSLLSSASGSGPLSQIFRGIQRWRRQRYAWRGKRSGDCVVSLLGQFYRKQLNRMGQFCRMAQRATRSGGPWASWTAPSPRHCSWVQPRRH